VLGKVRIDDDFATSASNNKADLIDVNIDLIGGDCEMDRA
jgi:hypothetical protein